MYDETISELPSLREPVVEKAILPEVAKKLGIDTSSNYYVSVE